VHALIAKKTLKNYIFLVRKMGAISAKKSKEKNIKQKNKIMKIGS